MHPLLTGIGIVDLTSVILGPFATQILGDLGADVIKVEPPDGDSMRPIPPTAAPGLSAIFANNNRNKRSIVLDLKHADGKRVLERLIARSDVLIHNMRQEAIDRLGFSAAACHAINPRLVYCAAVGFGSAGPYAGRPAYDDIIQAASGFAGLRALRGEPPSYAPSIIADKVVGLTLVHAVLAALLARERTDGNGLHVEVPMFETMAAFILNEHLGAATFEPEGSVGYHRMLAPERKPYRTADGWVAVLPYTLAHWRKALAAIGRSDVAAAEWLQDATERSRRTPELYGVIADVLPQRTSQEWLDIFERLDVPCAPVNSPAGLLSDAHLAAIGFFSPQFAAPSPICRTLNQPVAVHGAPPQPDRPPPLLGADTADVLRELGWSEEDIARMRGSRGVG